MKLRSVFLWLTAIIIVLFLIRFAFYVEVTAYEQAVKLSLGQITKEIEEPGWYFRFPGIESIEIYPKKIQTINVDASVERENYRTNQKEFLIVDYYIRWKIVDPSAFFKAHFQPSLGDVDDLVFDSELKVAEFEILDQAESNLIDLISITNPIEFIATVKRESITEDLIATINPILNRRGIEVIEISVQQANFAVGQTKYIDLMVENTNQEINRISGLAEGEKEKIELETEGIVASILAEGQKQALQIEGEAEREALSIYLKALAKDPDFFKFIKRLEVYEGIISSDDQIIVSPDSDLFKTLLENGLDCFSTNECDDE